MDIVTFSGAEYNAFIRSDKPSRPASNAFIRWMVTGSLNNRTAVLKSVGRQRYAVWPWPYPVGQPAAADTNWLALLGTIVTSSHQPHRRPRTAVESRQSAGRQVPASDASSSPTECWMRLEEDGYRAFQKKSRTLFVDLNSRVVIAVEFHVRACSLSFNEELRKWIWSSVVSGQDGAPSHN